MPQYYLNILKKLSLYKVYNFARLFLSFHYSRRIGKAVQSGMPLFVSIEPTTSCNLRCPQCPSGLREFTRPTGMLKEDFFQSLILQLKKHLFSLTFYFQGEPYLNPDFLKMVAFANEQGIYTITSTNAHYLNAENATATVNSKLNELIISVDGSSQESYSKYRVGGQLERVIEGTKHILQEKKELKSKFPHVVWQFIVFKHNEGEIAEIRRLGEKLGVNEIRIKTAQIYDYENGEEWIPENPKYSRYEKNQNGIFRIKNKLLNQCWRMWQGCVITWDGKVVPCCFDKDAKYQLGELKQQSFASVWQSKEYNQFRQSILKGRNQIDICTNCTEGTKVWA